MRRLAALIAVAVAAGAALVLRSSPDHKRTTPTLLATNPAQVRRIVITSGAERAELTRDFAGAWHAAAGSAPQAATLLFSFEDRLLPMRAYRAISADPADPQFGLRPPALAVRIEGEEFAERELAFGAPSFTGGGFYAHRVGDPGRLYLVPRQALSDLRSVLEGRVSTGADPLREAADRAESVQDKGELRMSPWLQQVLDSGAWPAAGRE